MKVTIESETDAERKLLAESWVRTGCTRLALSGIGDRTDDNPTGEIGYLHGDNIGLRGDIARIIALLDAQLMQQTTVGGLLQANQMIGQANAERAIAQEVLQGRNGLRIHRP